MGSKRYAWLCPETDVETLAGACKQALREAGFGKIVSRKAKGDVLIGGTYGSTLLALVVRFLPFGQYFPWGNRYRAEMKAGIYKDTPRLRMEVFPIMELFNKREMFFITQDFGEAIADSVHAGRFRDKILRSVESRVGAMEPLFTPGELKKRGRSRSRRRK